MANVKVKATDGLVIHVSANNPSYAHVEVEQLVFEFDNGFMRPRLRSARIYGKVEDLQQFDAVAGQVLPGRIVVEETLIPIKGDDVTFGIKRAFKDGPICSIDDQPIYRKTLYTEDLTKKDILIKHDNGEEIKAAGVYQRSVAADLTN